MLSTMQDSYPLSVQALFEQGARLFADSEVVTFTGAGTRRIRFGKLAQRVRCLAAALKRLGVQPGDRVATFCWNTQEHLEAYFAIPCMGAVLHTVNIRLFPDQIAYVINHAEDRVILLDASLIPSLLPILSRLETVRHFVIIGDGAAEFPGAALGYEDILAAEKPEFVMPALNERSAAAMCYTSGTTGNPKGVVYSHRSIYLHSMAAVSATGFAITQRDRVLVAPSMFHANGWGMPHAGWWVGADLILPGRFLQAEPLGRLIAAERPTFFGRGADDLE